MLSNFENKLRIKLFRKSKKINIKNTDILKLNESNKTDYDNIFSGKLDYLIIKNFISPSEIKTIQSNIASIKQEKKSFNEKTKTGLFLGKSLLEKNSLEEYFIAARDYHEQEINLLGFSFNDRIKEVIHQITSLKNIEIPKNKNNESYLGNSVRILEASKAAFPAHTDKFVHDKSEKTVEINNIISNENMISFFALIKKAEKGGRLFIMHKLFKDTPQEVLNELTHGDYTNVQRYIYKHEVIEVNMDEGDLILFDAGQRWHMVEPIYGFTDRITVGCFTSYNKEKTKIYYWS